MIIWVTVFCPLLSALDLNLIFVQIYFLNPKKNPGRNVQINYLYILTCRKIPNVKIKNGKVRKFSKIQQFTKL